LFAKSNPIMLCVVLTVLLGLLATFSTAQTPACRLRAACFDCLENPSCGWCATSGACVAGSNEGPTEGTCNNWRWYTCTQDAQWQTYGGSTSRAAWRDVHLRKPVQPTLRFAQNLTEGQPCDYVGAPVISSGTVYTANFCCVTHDLTVFAHEAMTGSLLWNYTKAAYTNFPSTPTLAGDFLLVDVPITFATLWAVSLEGVATSYEITIRSSLPAGPCPYGAAVLESENLAFVPNWSQLAAVNLTSHAVVWNVDVQQGVAPPIFYWGVTVYRDKRVLFVTETKDPNQLAGLGEVDPLNGHITWLHRVPPNEANTLSEVCSVPVVSGDIVLGVHWNQHNVTLFAYHMEEERLLWDFSCGAPFVSDPYPRQLTVDLSPAADGANAYFVCADHIQVLDLKTGKPSAPPIACPHACYPSKPLVLRSHLIFNTGFHGIAIHSLMQDDPQPDILMSGVNGNLAFANGLLYVTTGDSLHAYDLFGNSRITGQ